MKKFTVATLPALLTVVILVMLLGGAKNSSEDRIDKLQEQIALLSRTSPPVGTVMAFAGEWPDADRVRDPNKKKEMEKARKKKEKDLGWMLVDGRELTGDEYGELARKVIGGQSLPDYRGYFLRGAKTERQINSKEEYATRLPQNPFTTDNGIVQPTDHYFVKFMNTIALMRYTGNNPKNKYDLLEVHGYNKPGFAHKHGLGGGDTETRPQNYAVHWIIKFK